MRVLRWLPWAILALLLVLLLCHGWFGPDIWYHLYLGGRIAATGRAQPSDHLFLQQPGFINLYWLFQLVTRGAYALGGMVGVSALFIAVWAVALGFWLGTAGAFRAGAWGPPLALAILLVCQNRFEQRPEIFSYAFLAMQIQWLAQWKLAERPARGEFARFALVEALWANMHGYFAFGPFLVGLKLVAWLPNCRRGQVSGGNISGDVTTRNLTPSPSWQPGWVALWPLLGLTLVASITSPFGLRNWEEVAVLGNFLGRMHLQIQEFLPPTGYPPLALWTVKLFWCYWAAVLAATVFVLRTAARRELFALLLAVVGLCLSTSAFRNIPLVVFFSAPLAAAVLGRRGQTADFKAAAGDLKIRGLTPSLATAALGAGLGAWVVTGGFYRSTHTPSGFGVRASEYAYPTRFAEYLRATGFRGSVFNQSADGGYLEFYFPDLPLYGDSRFVDARLTEGYFAAIRSPDGFAVLHRRFAFDGALLPILVSREVIAVLLRDPAWQLAYADLHRAFLVNLRSPAGAAAPIQPPLFYRGEDLTRPEYGAPAAAWIGLFADLDDRQNLLLALGQFSRAPRVPMTVFEIALDYARKTADTELIAAVAALRPHLLPRKPGDAEAIDWLLQRSR